MGQCLRLQRAPSEEGLLNGRVDSAKGGVDGFRGYYKRAGMPGTAHNNEMSQTASHAFAPLRCGTRRAVSACSTSLGAAVSGHNALALPLWNGTHVNPIWLRFPRR